MLSLLDGLSSVVTRFRLWMFMIYYGVEANGRLSGACTNYAVVVATG
jgi:hypothetical protein